MSIEGIREKIINKVTEHLRPMSKTTDKEIEIFIDNLLSGLIENQAKEIEELKGDLSDMSDNAEYHRVEEVTAKEENTQLKERIKELEKGKFKRALEIIKIEAKQLRSAEFKSIEDNEPNYYGVNYLTIIDVDGVYSYSFTRFTKQNGWESELGKVVAFCDREPKQLLNK